MEPAERRARELLRSASPPADFDAYERLGFFSVPGRGDPASGYAYLVYPHRPLVAYETATGRLLSEYCVRFRDDGERLPDADDVLAKWLALHGRERELIATANIHPPGRQVDPDHVRRDLARLARAGADRRLPPTGERRRRHGDDAARARARRRSSTAPTAPPRAPT